MCRWLAYSGPSIPLAQLVLEPENSLVRQSLSAREGRSVTNGDGFGLGWYDIRPFPGQYRDVRPAWNDANLHSLSRQIESHLFFAHVRASTGTPTGRVNCHPFRHGEWLFMHNGQIGGYGKLRHELDRRISDENYTDRLGATDSEAIFLLAVGHGLKDDPKGALARTIGEVEALMREHGVTSPLRASIAVTDGKQVVALRYSSDHSSPTLYCLRGGCLQGHMKCEVGPAVLVLSEPLDDAGGDWTEVPEAHMLVARDGGIELEPFEPLRG